MATASVTNTFVAATAAVASEVNTNFTNLVDFANNSTIHRDGSKAFTGNMDAGSNKIVNLTAGTAATDAASVANVTNSIPAGTITMYGGSSAPALWLLCDGTAVSRVTYAALFAAIGTAFGVGDGATTFNLPNFQDKYPIGDSGTLTLGATVGSNDAVLVSHSHTFSGTSSIVSNDHTHGFTTGGHSASHTHGGNDNGFVYWANTYGAGQATDPSLPGGSWGLSWQTQTGGASNDHTHSGTTGGISANHTHTYSGTTSTPGVSATNANRPSSVVVNYIIRAGV